MTEGLVASLPCPHCGRSHRMRIPVRPLRCSKRPRRSTPGPESADADGAGLRALLALTHLEGDTSLLVERLESVGLDVREVDEQLVATRIAHDEPVAAA